ncbi:MAG: hypothetical protein Q8Q44_12510, partial [Nocardioides sp.]|nr:hypothetical protein [Nocardioides sp.]
MGRHRLERVRPRYGRMLSATCALAVTLVAVAGGVGGFGGTTSGPGGAMPVASAGLAVAAELAPDNANAGNAEAAGGAGVDADAAAGADEEASPDTRRQQRQARRKQATAGRSEEEPVARSSTRSTAL